MLLPDSELLARLVSFVTVSDQPMRPAVDWLVATVCGTSAGGT